MPTYAGVTFQVVHRDGFRPDWHAVQRVARRPLPYNTGEDVQFLGLDNSKLTLPEVVVAADADVTTLMAARGSTQRTLGSYYGLDHLNVILTEVTPPKRHVDAGVIVWLLGLQFEKDSV